MNHKLKTVLTFRIDENQQARLQQAAQQAQLSQSDIVRAALNRYFAEEQMGGILIPTDARR